MRRLMHLPAARSIRSGLQGRTFKWLLLASTVGLLTGLAGLAFYWATERGFELLVANPRLVNYQEVKPDGELQVSGLEHAPTVSSGPATGVNFIYLLLLLPLGGLAAGLIARYIDRNVAGAGTGAALQTFHQSGGVVSLRTSAAKFVASCCTYCTGGSAGREGPIALIGAGLASSLGRVLQVSARDRRVLMVAGMAGGIAALFRAPLAGALFAAEVLYRDPDVESEVLIPGFIAAIVSYCTFGVLYGALLPEISSGGAFLTPLFATPELFFDVNDVGHLLPYLAVAGAVVLCCRLHVGCEITVERLAQRLPGPVWLRPAAGALATGLIAWAVVQALWYSGLLPWGNTSALALLGGGYGILQQALTGSSSIQPGFSAAAMLGLLLVVGLGKIVTTSLTVGSGGSGGTFGPSLVIGGCLGGAIGFGLQALPWLPAQLTPPPAACVVMGMAGYLAVGYKTPLAGLLMITDMTGSYSLLLPGMWVVVLAYLFGGSAAVVSGQVASPLQSPAHRGHFFTDILAGISLGAVFDPDRPVRTLAPHDGIDRCKQIVTECNQNVYPVVDAEGVLCGIFSLNDLRSFLYDDALGLVAVAQDVATTEIIVVAREDSLAVALRRFTERNLEELPVVETRADGRYRFLGLISRRQVIAHYNRVVDELRAQRLAEGYDDPRRPTSGRQEK